MPDWQGNTEYKVYDLVKYLGTVYQRDSDGNSETGFEISNWTGEGPLHDAWYGQWHTGTDYEVADVVEYDGDAYESRYDFTSGAAFDVGNWELMGPDYVERFSWKSYHVYALNDEVRHEHYAYRAKDNLISVDVFNPDNWDLIGPAYDSRYKKWEANRPYFPNDVVQYNFGRSYKCITQEESINESSFDESKWKVIWGAETLVPGTEKWCAGCHDEGNSEVEGVAAPSVIGDGSTYGYFVSGHGRPTADLSCEECHDLTIKHTDTRQRTYEALATKPAKSYQNGYRLHENMTIPRDGEVGADVFSPCTNDNCHAYNDIISSQISGFRDDLGDKQGHLQHLEWILMPFWDSDWSSTPGGENEIDSDISCPACHNVHGSPTPAMIRHGELISTPGTDDKVPALDFKWYRARGKGMSDSPAFSR
ncbi:MAG: hypothetical protein JRI70_10935 [Deltaproteobacteria bacterium]|nr:hypothetical protein [Deltaproteobacteria bacterium]